MTLNRFTVSRPFNAWRPGDRDNPDHRILISPGSKRLFTDDAEPFGTFIKFLESGSWYEAARDEFMSSTILIGEPQQNVISVQRGA